MSEPISVNVGQGEKLRLTNFKIPDIWCNDAAAFIPLYEGNNGGSTFDPSQSVNSSFYDDIFFGIDIDNFLLTHSDFLDSGNAQRLQPHDSETEHTPKRKVKFSRASPRYYRQLAESTKILRGNVAPQDGRSSNAKLPQTSLIPQCVGLPASQS